MLDITPKNPALRLLGLVLWLAAAAVAETRAAESLDLALPGGTEIPVVRAPAEGPNLLLWLPSEFGLRPPQIPAARELAARGVETWVADLHGAYFLPPGRDSLNAVPVDDLVELIAAVRRESGKRIVLAATGRGARLVLEAARAWQMHGGQARALAGGVLFHPYLYAGRPLAGEDPELLPVVYASNLPLFIIQPSLSAKHWRIQELTEALRQGGAQVFTQALPGVTDGFHLRPEADLSPADLAARRDLPALLTRAVSLLARRPMPAQAAPLPPPAGGGPTGGPEPGLRPLNGEPAPALALRDLEGGRWSLSRLQGQVVLVSFWASWCPPCVEEWPSLVALHQRLGPRGLRLLSVNVGEDAATVREFLARHPADFPVLLDPEGGTVAPWRVYAYPTNYLIDAQGRLRLGHFGAMDWTSPEVIAKIEDLLNSIDSPTSEPRRSP